jgi:hypothetical protein
MGDHAAPRQNRLRTGEEHFILGGSRGNCADAPRALRRFGLSTENEGGRDSVRCPNICRRGHAGCDDFRPTVSRRASAASRARCNRARFRDAVRSAGRRGVSARPERDLGNHRETNCDCPRQLGVGRRKDSDSDYLARYPRFFRRIKTFATIPWASAPRPPSYPCKIPLRRALARATLPENCRASR